MILLALPATAEESGAATTHKAVTKATTKTMQRAWTPQTLSGRIMMVDPAARLVVVKGPDGVPFDIRVTAATHIREGSQTLNLPQLSAQTHKEVSVRFIPERTGDIAQTIRIASQA